MKKNLSNKYNELLSKVKQQEVSAHYWHLLAFNNPDHKQLKKYYTSLNDLFDSIAEYFMGCTSRLELVPPSNIEIIALTDFNGDFSLYKTFYMMQIEEFISCMRDYLEECEDLALQDILIGGVQMATSTRYLLNM